MIIRKRLTWTFLIVLLVVAGILPSSPPLTASVGSSPEEPLRLTIEAISSEYCVGDKDLDSLRLKLRLTYTNRADKPIILYKGSSLVSRISIARSIEDLTERRFEVNSSITQVTSATRDCSEGSKPSNCFVVLSPNSVYETKTVTGLFVVRDDARAFAGAVGSGEHVLQIETATWSGSDQIAQELRSRWRGYGSLWYEAVTSDPMPIKVEKHRKVNRCK